MERFTGFRRLRVLILPSRQVCWGVSRGIQIPRISSLQNGSFVTFEAPLTTRSSNLENTNLLPSIHSAITTMLGIEPRVVQLQVSSLICPGGAIFCWSKEQRNVTISSVEAEYVALSADSCDIVWLQWIFYDLGCPQGKPAVITGDNDSSLLLSKHPTNHSRTKHIRVHYHFTWEKLFDKMILLRWILTRSMMGDMFTKPMKGASQRTFTYEIGLRRV